MYPFNINTQKFSTVSNADSGENSGRELHKYVSQMQESHTKGYQKFELAPPVESQVVAIALQPKDIDEENEEFVDPHLGMVTPLTHSDKIEDENNLTKLSSDRQLEMFISSLLKYGVLLSSTVVLVGSFLYLMNYGADLADYRFFQGEPSQLCSPLGVVNAAVSGSYRGIIQLGLLILIGTPMARVAFSFLAFLRQRDFPYIIVTLLVLVALIYSIIGAYS